MSFDIFKDLINLSSDFFWVD